MPIGDSISLHTTTRNQIFKFPSFTCHKVSHGLKKTWSISALGISEDSSNDNTVHNGVLYSIPKVAICSLCYIWTNHHCSGKIFFVLHFSTHNIQGKAFCTLQHLPICRGSALGDCCWDGNLKKSISECHAIMVKSTWHDRKPAITVCVHNYCIHSRIIFFFFPKKNTPWTTRAEEQKSLALNAFQTWLQMLIPTAISLSGTECNTIWKAVKKLTELACHWKLTGMIRLIL